jgi:hypothetical protein
MRLFTLLFAGLFLCLGYVKATVTISGSSATINGTSYFANINFGTVAPGSLILQGAAASTTQNSGDDVCTVFADYSVSGGGPAGTLTLSFISQTGSAPDWNKTFGIAGQTIDVSSLPNGSYTLTINYRIFGRFGGVTCFGSTNPFNTGTLSTRTFTFIIDSSLPIELTAFKAKENGASVLLQWETAREINNDFFAIERSNNGQNWQEISRMDSKADNDRQRNVYAFEDLSPMRGANYYRLRQVDKDGRFSYSSVVLEQRGGRFAGNIFPNPVIETLQINNAEEDTRVHLYDVLGKLVLETTINGTQTLSMTQFNSGVYQLVLLSSDGVQLHSERIVKQ